MDLLNLSIEEYTFICGSLSLLAGLSSRKYCKRKDRSRNLVLPSLADPPNPYFIAYLTGGKNELLRVMLIALTIKNHLQVEDYRGESIFYSASKAPDSSSLMSVEQEILKCFRLYGPQTKYAIGYRLKSLINEYAVKLRDEAAHKNYIFIARESNLLKNVRRAGFYFLVAGIFTQEISNQNFSAWSFVFSSYWAWILFAVVTSLEGRKNNLGDRYLAFLEGKYSLSKYSGGAREEDRSYIIIQASIFGEGALKNTTFSYLSSVIKGISIDV